jgi:transcriptional regulator with XRE-family HTH domain
MRMLTSKDRAFLVALGKRIREIREKRRISQEELGFRCELDRTYISSIERGRRNVGVANLKRIARALNVGPSVLLPDRD